MDKYKEKKILFLFGFFTLQVADLMGFERLPLTP